MTTTRAERPHATPRADRLGPGVLLAPRRARDAPLASGSNPPGLHAFGGLKTTRRSILALATVALFLAGAPVAQAASCNSSAHQLTLSGGKATPGSGTTATKFTFTVTYKDSRGCAPSIASVQISGVGSFGLTGAGTRYKTGVTYSRTMTLPAGSHTYLFAFTSGTGAGVKSTKLTTVAPASVVVVAPTPVPTPIPTKKPAPKPPAPKPPAPPAVTPVPATPAASPSASASDVPSPSESASGAETPAADRMSGWEGALFGGLPGNGSPGGGAPGPGLFDLTEAGLARIGAWVATTAGGIGLFLLLMRQGRRAEDGSLPQQLTLPEAPAWRAPTHAVAAEVPPDEVNLPRWLRPSVQAARGRRRS